MPGRALLLTHDAQLSSVVQEITREVGFALQRCETVDSAKRALAGSTFDAVMVDPAREELSTWLSLRRAGAGEPGAGDM